MLEYLVRRADAEWFDFPRERYAEPGWWGQPPKASSLCNLRGQACG
jgi:hypothetical protein